MNRDEAFLLLNEHTKSKSLIGHALSVEAAMRHYAGRMVWAPDANIDTPSLQIGIFTRVGRLQLPIYAFGFVSGWFRRFPGAVVRSVAEVRLSGPSTEPVQADGDVVAHLPVSVSVASVSAKILAPGQS